MCDNCKKLGAELLALREALLKRFIIKTLPDGHVCTACWRTARDGAADILHGEDCALSNTSATAQEIVERIEREALEKGLAKMEGIVQAIPINDFSVSKGDSAYNWGRYFVDQFSAAILGEKNT